MCAQEVLHPQTNASEVMLPELPALLKQRHIPRAKAPAEGWPVLQTAKRQPAGRQVQPRTGSADSLAQELPRTQSNATGMELPELRLYASPSDASAANLVPQEKPRHACLQVCTRGFWLELAEHEPSAKCTAQPQGFLPW